VEQRSRAEDNWEGENLKIYIDFPVFYRYIEGELVGYYTLLDGDI